MICEYDAMRPGHDAMGRGNKRTLVDALAMGRMNGCRP